MARSLCLLSALVSLLISEQVFADEGLGILDKCKKSCERSYPLHTYPKVSLKNHSQVVLLCNFFVLEISDHAVYTWNPTNIPNLMRLFLLFLSETRVISIVLMLIFHRRSLCLLVNKGVDYL